MQLHYKSFGEGKPIVILHGVFGASDNWLTLGKELGNTYQVFLLDLRNHGRSPHSDVFTYESMSHDVLEFLDDHQLHDPVIIGHSMGGKTAMYFALHHPDRLRKLIIVDIAPRYYPRHHDDILAGFAAVDVSALTSRQHADDQLAVHVPEPGVRQFLLKNLYRDEHQQFAWRINLPVLRDQIENIGEEITGNPADVPALFIRGSSSRYIQEKDHSAIQRLFPNATFIEIAGTGHWVHAEKPQETLHAIQEFIAKRES